MQGSIEYQIEQSAQNNFASVNAELSLLGCMAVGYDKCADIAAEIAETDFYYSDHRTIFKAIKHLAAEQQPVELITIDAELQKHDAQHHMQLTKKILEGTNLKQSIYHAKEYAQIIKALAMRRKAIALMNATSRELQKPGGDINAIMDKLRTDAADIAIGKDGWRSMSSILLATYDNLEQRIAGNIKPITTGIPNVDHIIGGFFGGELTIVGARPGVGKSVFGMNVALEAAQKGFKVGICSREMTDIQFGQRVISYSTNTDGMKIRKAELTDEDWLKITDRLDIASTLPIEFLFTIRTVEDLRAEVQRKHTRGEIDMLVVDYLQLMDTRDGFREDRLRVGHISKALKDMAVDFNIPVIALAQVKRYAGGARIKMPSLEDLKDSGNLEQDADGVIFLHRPYDEDDEYIDPRDKGSFNNYAENGFSYICIGIAKQRQGMTGQACVLFNMRNMRYHTIDRRTH